MHPNAIPRLIVAGLILGLAGCATPSLFKTSKDDFPKAGPKNPVTRIMGLWQPATGYGPHDKPCRGFSGQIFFFTKDSEVPARVDGDVKFFVYDDQGSPETQATPVYEGNFEPDAWNQYFSKGTLGASYQIFVPYTRPGNHTANCKLRVRYTPRGGGAPIYSDVVDIGVEGKKKPESDDAQSAPDDAADRGAGAPEAASRGRLPQPPFARGASQAVTIRQEPKSPRRDRVPELTEADRARMFLEVKSRLESPAGDGVALVSHQEQPKQRAPVRSRPVGRKPRNPLLDDDASPAVRSPDEEDQADEPPRAVRAAAGARSVRPAARHLLDDEDADASPDSDEPAPVRSWQKRTAPAPATHVLDDARRQPSRPAPGDSAQTFTIQLSKSVFDGS